MAEYYRSEIRSVHGDYRKRRNPLGILLDALLLIFSWVVALLMLLTFLAPHIAPSGWFFPILGLVAPATYVLTVMLALYWIFRWRWKWAVLMLIPTVVGLFHLNLFLKLELKRDYGDKPSGRGVVKIVSYNLRQFYGPDGACSRDSVAAWIARERPDILCLQEFHPTTGNGSRELVDSLIGDDYFSTTGDTLTTNAIYSRFKILRSGRTLPRVKSVRSIWADLLVSGDTVRVYNHHLSSTAITSADEEFLTTDNFLQDTAREAKVRSIVKRFRDNSIARAEQADTIARTVAASPHRAILCGDFNDTPMSYVYRTMSRGFNDAFSEAGKNYSHTYNGFNNALRIDFILLDPQFEVLSYEVPPLDYSDHYPVVVAFRKKR